jgi:single-strand DNA-binding protein
MLNKVILQGNVGHAPKIFLTQGGKEVANFSLATSMVWKDKDGEWQSATDWHQITVFRESTVRQIKDLLKRGDPVYVEGKLIYQRWTDKYGQSRITAHVVVPGYGGRVTCLKPSQSNSQESPFMAETEQEVASSKASSCLAEDDYPCPSSENPDEDPIPTQPSQDTE